jgi:hypothetical protein
MGAVYRIDGNSAGGVDAVGDLTKALSKTDDAAEKAAKASKRLEEQAKRIKEAVDPQEKYNRKIQELAAHVDNNRLSLEHAQAAALQYGNELNRTGEKATRAAENQRRGIAAAIAGQQQLVAWENKVAAASAKATLEEERLVAAALRIRETISPIEKLNRLTVELAQHVKAERLTLDEATQAHMRHRQELGLAASAIDKVDTANTAAFGESAARRLISYLAGLATIGSAISLIRGELQTIVATSDRAAQKTITVAQSEANLRRVVATDPARDRVVASAFGVANQRKLPTEGVLDAFTAAYGSTSDADLTIRTIEAAAEKTRDTTKLAQTAAGIGFILQSSSIKDAREAGGFIDQVLAISPIKDEKVPQALAKVVGSFNSPTAGGSEATAGAVLGLLSQAAADVEGDRSRTGTITLEGKLDSFFDKNRKKFRLAKDASDGIDEQLAFLFDDKNKDAAAAFISSTKFEAPVSGGFSTLFLDPNYRQRFREALPELGSRDARLRAAGDTAGFVNASSIQDAARTNEAVSALIDEFDLSQSGAGTFTDANRKKFVNLLATAENRTNFATDYLGVFLRTGAVLEREEAVGELEGFQSRMAAAKSEGFIQTGASLSAEKTLNDMLTALRGIEAGQRSRATTRQRNP